jgi:DNA integrity scanning protein DisA with diadenylate cyclase activity
MNPKLTIKVLLWLIAAVSLFHLTILIKIIPYEITWGGKLKNDAEMYLFESISILINLFLTYVLLIKGEYVSKLISTKVVNIILWIFLFIFGLNTLGNIFAETIFEKSLSLLTLVFTFLLWNVLKKSKKNIVNKTGTK